MVGEHDVIACYSRERVPDQLSRTQVETLPSSLPSPPSLNFLVDNSYFMEFEQFKRELQKFLGVALY